MWNNAKEWGGRYFNDDITAGKFDDPKTVEAFQWVWDVKYKHELSPTTGDSEVFGGEWGAFATGRIGLFATLGDECRALLEAIGDKFVMGVAGEPLGPAGVRYGFEGNCGWVVPSGSKYPDVAYEWTRFYLTSDERARFLAVSGFGGFPARISSGDWLVRAMEEQLPNFDHAVRELGKECEEHFPLFPEYLEWTGLYQKWIDPVMVEGKPGVEEALVGMSKDTDDLLSTAER